RGLKSATIDEEGRDADGVEEGGLELVGAEADKADGVAARRDREAVRGVEPVARVRGREGAHRGAVDLHPEGLVANGGAEGPLGGQEAEAVGAGREVDRLADAALLLQEGDLEALGGGGVAAGEAAAVGGQARAVAVVLVRAGELPGR